MNHEKLLFCISLNLLLVLLLIGPSLIRQVRAQTPYLKFVKEYYYAPLLNSNPHGRLNVIVTICKLMNDGNPNYDWYFYSNNAQNMQGIRIQTVPGKVCYGSDWETAHTYAKHVVYNPSSLRRWLVDYDPTTTNGYNSATATAVVSVTSEGSGSMGYSISYTYSIPYIKVIDYSDFAVNRAYWEHDFNEKNDPVGAPSDSTYLARPAFIVKTVQNEWSYVDAWYSVMWGHPVLLGWEYQTFQAGPLYLDAYMSGDT